MQGWLSILIMIALGAGFALISVLLSNVLGPSKPTPEKRAPYECGMPPVGKAAVASLSDDSLALI